MNELILSSAPNVGNQDMSAFDDAIILVEELKLLNGLGHEYSEEAVLQATPVIAQLLKRIKERRALRRRSLVSSASKTEL